LDLTRRQKWRIEKIQAERIARAHKSSATTEQNSLKNSEGQAGLVITRFGQHLLVESQDGELFKCTGRKNIELSVAGDQVIFQPTDNEQGIVLALLERKNELNRAHKLIATNIDQLWVVVAIEPHYQFELIDRYLVVAHSLGIEINIVVNKIDLSTNIDKIKQDFLMYAHSGYIIHYLSVVQNIGIDTFKQALNHKNQLFLGQSGVGKSSLINALIPELDLRVNEISTKSKLGKHTTTNTTLYHIPSGGNLIDSPGVREFQLDNLSNQEILKGFKEFSPFLGLCKFRNCTHTQEPKCAIKQALENGEIHSKRYASYLSLIT
jgi:ribosome biogenesis GTPase